MALRKSSFSLIKTLHFELPLQIEANDWGNKLEIGLPNKHTFSRFVKSTKAFLLNETILLDSKFKYFKLIKSLKVPSSILVIRWIKLIFGVKWVF